MTSGILIAALITQSVLCLVAFLSSVYVFRLSNSMVKTLLDMLSKEIDKPMLQGEAESDDSDSGQVQQFRVVKPSATPAAARQPQTSRKPWELDPEYASCEVTIDNARGKACIIDENDDYHEEDLDVFMARFSTLR